MFCRYFQSHIIDLPSKKNGKMEGSNHLHSLLHDSFRTGFRKNRNGSGGNGSKRQLKDNNKLRIRPSLVIGSIILIPDHQQSFAESLLFRKRLLQMGNRIPVLADGMPQGSFHIDRNILRIQARTGYEDRCCLFHSDFEAHRP